jgi:hypothetical protein
MKNTNQLFRTHSNLFTTKRYYQDFAPISNNFKNSDLYILAAFSNVHLKNDMYHTTATTIFSETPFEFKHNILMKEGLEIMNMNRLRLFIVEDIPITSERSILVTGVKK